MFYDILGNREWYYPIDLQMVSSFESEFRDLCTQAHMKGLIAKDVLKYLVNPYPRTSTFYTFVHQGDLLFPVLDLYLNVQADMWTHFFSHT